MFPRTWALWFVALCISACQAVTEPTTLPEPDLGVRLDPTQLSLYQDKLYPLKASATNVYNLSRIVILLPDRLNRFDEHFYTPYALLKAWREHKLPYEIKSAFSQTVVEYQAGYFQLTNAQQRWLAQRPDEVVTWWSVISRRPSSSNNSTVKPDGQPAITPPDTIFGGGDTLLRYFRNRSELLETDELLSPAETLAYVNAHPALLEEGVAALKRTVTFKASLLTSEDASHCDILNAAAFGTFLNTQSLNEDKKQTLYSRCKDSNIVAWYSQLTPSAFYSENIDTNTINYIQGELWATKTIGTQYQIPSIYKEILQLSLERLIEGINSKNKAILKGTTIHMSTKELDVEGLFHARTSEGEEKRIRISSLIVRAASARCRNIHVRASQKYDKISDTLQAIYTLQSPEYDTHSFFDYLPQANSPFIDFNFEIERQPPTYSDLFHYELDLRDLFDDCMFQQLSFLLAHELAHITHPGNDVSETQRDCLAKSFLHSEVLAYSLGVEFLDRIMLGAIDDGVDDLWGLNNALKTEIRSRFDTIHSDTCQDF